MKKYVLPPPSLPSSIYPFSLLRRKVVLRILFHLSFPPFCLLLPSLPSRLQHRGGGGGGGGNCNSFYYIGPRKLAGALLFCNGVLYPRKKGRKGKRRKGENLCLPSSAFPEAVGMLEGEEENAGRRKKGRAEAHIFSPRK